MIDRLGTIKIVLYLSQKAHFKIHFYQYLSLIYTLIEN